ncbi:type VII secretion target [Mycobacterium sp. 141]|uniref:type VII secretion target n=1 Tax=Mycobacterium sp. 141 TaxID=1120797 RepID=UPI000370E653|nr:type VII secretion target [Mycobacterium sp. 141]
MTQFNADVSAVAGLGQQLDDVSSSARNVLDGAAGSVSNSHGAIGFPMQKSFEAMQTSRSAAVGATQAASAELGALLRQAAQAYQRGDTAAADRLKARAAELEASGDQGSSPTGPTGHR